MYSDIAPESAVNVMREIIVSLVRRDGPSLSAHQLGVFLTCYLQDADHTVRGLSRDLGVSKSVITRALDRLGELKLVARRVDPLDARSVIIDRTPAGVALMDELNQIALRVTRHAQGAS
jgi:DNA-binding MarR family transcriptional regulator